MNLLKMRGSRESANGRKLVSLIVADNNNDEE
jgi:hypothetical protein